MTQNAATSETTPTPEQRLGRLVDLAATMRRTPSRVVQGDELDWVSNRVAEIRNAVAPDRVVAVRLTVTRRLAEQLSLQASGRAADAGDPTWRRWTNEGIEYQLDHVIYSGDDLTRGHRFDAGALLDTNVWFGPIPGIAYASAVDPGVHETRWVLEILDGSDPATADCASRLLR